MPRLHVVGAQPAARRGKWWRRPLLRGLVLAAVLLAAAAAVVVWMMPGTSAPQPPANTVVASLPYWNITAGAEVTLANRNDFTEVSPWMFGLDAQGRIAPLYDPREASAVQASTERLRAAGLSLMPTLANVSGGQFTDQPITGILHDPTLTANHIAAIVALVTDRGYAGIDIDYEELNAADRSAFTTFITDLAAALHAHGKRLSVALFAKTTDAGYDQRNLAQDYAAIGRVADEVRLMAYDYHWATSPPGPVAPIGWVRDVLRYATSQIPAAKIVLGIPLSGYDWSGGSGTVITWQQAFQLANRYHAPVQYDTVGQSPWFTYTDDAGRPHEVWLENAASTRAKLDAAHGAGVGGVYLWMYGSEDAGTWTQLEQAFPVERGTPSGSAVSR
ncbi:glycosyl hydrolase family 18 protein [Amycolatopsis acididurans]|uniref:glycosyl hydrolase family 18 protein n=1 Tax=Amycolatopsis acididurans TaxID=2724524 RepID=UPI0028A780DF|nr:glycosyl hydrolase family 18 protein [Amycolatopsis acididurans]